MVYWCLSSTTSASLLLPKAACFTGFTLMRKLITSWVSPHSHEPLLSRLIWQYHILPARAPPRTRHYRTGHISLVFAFSFLTAPALSIITVAFRACNMPGAPRSRSSSASVAGCAAISIECFRRAAAGAAPPVTHTWQETRSQGQRLMPTCVHGAIGAGVIFTIIGIGAMSASALLSSR